VISDDYLFWPRFNTSVSKQTEPDLLIILWHSEKECSLALIESKFNSGKSSEADYDVEEITDQLARELLILESKEIFTQNPILSDVNIISKALFYVTADDIMPRESLNKSANEFVLKIKNKQSIEEFPFYWLPWWMIEHVICQNKLVNQDDISKSRIVKHVRDILSKKRLKRFNGFKCFSSYPLSLAYNSDFKESMKNYNFKTNFLSIQYKYQAFKSERTYNFFLNIKRINYSYKKENTT
ncbi:MAG: hypothetical protein KAT05_09855, partial [Spirochaetes bacterium]|nr:hypothetical protein [Spirochaetota bacterium]